MKHVWSGLSILLLGVGIVCGQDVAGKRIVLRTAGNVDAKWVERVLAFSRENTGLDIQATEPIAGALASLNDAANAASEQLGSEDAFAVVLVGITTDETAHGICLSEKRVAVINVRALLADQPDEERAGRRLDRQVMQSIGMLAGMPPCPNPQCVLWAYTNMEELDAKGRNLCPPCYDKLQQKAHAQGLRFSGREVLGEEEQPESPEEAVAGETVNMPQPE